jgi:hypothetical protein
MLAEDGVTLLGEVKGDSFIIKSDNSSRLDVKAEKGGISLQKGFVVTKSSTIEISKKTILKFENATVETNGEFPYSAENLVGHNGNGINRFRWSYGYSAGSLDVSNTFIFNSKNQTLEKTLDVSTMDGGIRHLKVRFLGVTPRMLEAVGRDCPLDANSYGRDWTQEECLPQYGVRVVEVLETNDRISLPDWKKWKVRIVWHCPRPKATP